jgi:hypothetical protein
MSRGVGNTKGRGGVVVLTPERHSINLVEALDINLGMLDRNRKGAYVNMM